MHGKGIVKFANDDVYDGKWAHGTRHGKVTLKMSDGSVYEQDWHEGILKN